MCVSCYDFSTCHVLTTIYAAFRTCGADSVSYDTFTDISLSIPRRMHPVARGSDGSGSVPRGTDTWAAKVSDKSTHPGVAHGGGQSVDAKPRGAVARDASGTHPAEGASAAPPEAHITPTAAAVETASDAAPAPANSRSSWCEMLTSLFKSESNTSTGGAGEIFRGLGPVGLGDCLYSFFDWEALTGPDQYFCERCACKRDADKRIGIACLPEVICIHLKRFSYSSSWGGTKNDAAVRFPLEGLDLGPFLEV